MKTEESKSQGDWVPLPCPFCGYVPTVCHSKSEDGELLLGVLCEDCGAQGGQENAWNADLLVLVPKLIAAWNRRTPIAEAEATQ